MNDKFIYIFRKLKLKKKVKNSFKLFSKKKSLERSELAPYTLMILDATTTPRFLYFEILFTVKSIKQQILN
jgi:hypothetical protein